MKKLFTAMFAVAALLLASSALAKPDDHGHDHGSNGHAAHSADADQAAHSEGGHDDGAGHHLYSHDDDHDGIANWMDFDNNGAGMTEAPLFKVIVHAANLLIFFGILFVFARRPIADALAGRALSIRKELEDSAKLRDEAAARNTELGVRLDTIENEIAGLREEAEQQAAHDEEKLVERAHNESKRIAGAAERSIRDEVQRARFALKRDAVALAVELAESALKGQMTGHHHQRLAKDFLDSLKEDTHV